MWYSEGVVGRVGEKLKRIFHLTGYITAMVSDKENRRQEVNE